MSQQVNDDYPNKPLSDKRLKEIAAAQYETQTTSDTQVFDFPTEIVELPSKGKLYSKDNPLSSGTIEMKYMTAKEEDILTNQSFIKNGVVLDKLFRSLIVSPIEYNDLLLCDKNAIMIAARVLGYGKDYECTVTNPESGEDQKVNIDLTQLTERDIDWSLIKDNVNEFSLTLPASKRDVKIKILTQRDQNKIDKETKAMAKLKRNASLTTMLKYVITEIDGDADNSKIRRFIDNELLAIDSRAIRKHLKLVTPDIDLSIDVPDEETGDTFRSQLNIGVDFFWPDAEI
jgi:hypothetical protein